MAKSSGENVRGWCYRIASTHKTFRSLKTFAALGVSEGPKAIIEFDHEADKAIVKMDGRVILEKEGEELSNELVMELRRLMIRKNTPENTQFFYQSPKGFADITREVKAA